MPDGFVRKEGVEGTVDRRDPTGWRARLVAHRVAITAALLMTAVVVTGLVVVSGRGGGVEAENPALVADIETEPVTGWSFSFASPGDTYARGMPVIVPVTDDTALVWPRTVPQVYDDQGGSGCYAECEDSSTDYFEGYDAGLWYAREYGNWRAFDGEGGVPRPTMEDYYPDGTVDSPNSDWVDGFNAARWSRGLDLPSFPFEVALIDLTTGDPVWELDVIEQVGASDYYVDLVATPVTGTGYIVFSVWDENVFPATTTLVSVDSTTGEVVSDTEILGYLTLETVEGGLFVLPSLYDDPWVGRLDPSDLSADPEWTNDVAGAWDLLSVGHYLVATDDKTSSFVFDARTGDIASWGDDIGPYVFYDIVDGQLIRYEQSEFSSRVDIMGSDFKGTGTWTEPVRRDWAFAAGSIYWPSLAQHFREGTTGPGRYLGANVVLVATVTQEALVGYERLNPKTGEPMWDNPYTGDIGTVIDVFSGVIIASAPEDGGIVAIDLATGEERFSQPMSGVITGVWPGAQLVYVSNDQGELTAFSLADGDEAWTYRFDAPAESILAMGDHLVVVNRDQRTLSLLR